MLQPVFLLVSSGFVRLTNLRKSAHRHRDCLFVFLSSTLNTTRFGSHQPQQVCTKMDLLPKPLRNVKLLPALNVTPATSTIFSLQGETSSPRPCKHKKRRKKKLKLIKITKGKKKIYIYIEKIAFECVKRVKATVGSNRFLGQIHRNYLEPHLCSHNCTSQRRSNRLSREQVEQKGVGSGDGGAGRG